MQRQPSFLATALLVIAGALVVIGCYGILLRWTFTGGYTGANDFFIPWRAIQALLWEGRDPYSPEVTAEIQQTLFGRLRGPEEHQYDFAYPLTLAPFLAPYTFWPYQWAQPLWQASVHFFLFGGMFLWFQSWRRRQMPPPLLLGLVVFWLVSLYPAARAFILGQVAMLIFVACALALWALVHEHDWVAGGALAAMSVKPQLSFLVLPLLVLVAWRAGRRQVVWACGVVLGALLLISLALQPTWPLAFVSRLGEYSQYTSLGSAEDSPSPLALLLRWGGLGDVALLQGSVALVILLPVMWWGWQMRTNPDWVALGAAALTASALVAPRSATTDQVMLLFPLTWLLAQLPRPVGLAVGALLWLGLWGLFFATIVGDQEALGVRLLFPLVVVGLWGWWVTRVAPQTGATL